MKISIGSDHGGFELKEKLISYMQSKGIEVENEGCFSLDSCDYPEFAKKVGNKVAFGQCEFGVLVCTTGIGMSITANKIKGVRAALIHEATGAEMTRRHNNANVICFGQKAISFDDACKCLDIFISTEFEGGRHQRRVSMMED